MNSPTVPDQVQPPVLTVIADLGSTLVDETDPDVDISRSAVLRTADGPRVAEALSALMSSLAAGAAGPSLRQEPSDAVIESVLGDYPGITRTHVEDLFWEAIGGSETSYLRPLPGAVHLLEEAAIRGARVVALSNTGLPMSILARIMSRHGLNRLVHAWFLSSEIGWKKPAPEAFACVQAEIAGSGRTVLWGNDWDADIAPAISLGWDAVWIRPDRGPGRKLPATVHPVVSPDAIRDAMRTYWDNPADMRDAVAHHA